MSEIGGGWTARVSLSATKAEELDRVCDRFEAAWRAGNRPVIDGYLEEVEEPLRSALLDELISLEIHWRRRRGEHPAAAEYHMRFPGHARALATALARTGARLAEAATPPAGDSTDRNAEASDSSSTASAIHDNAGSTLTSTRDDPARVVGGAESVGREGARFRVLRPYAHGGLGEVFVALDQELNREVALKELLMQTADNPASRLRFLNEAEITGGLEHPGIVPVYALGNYPDGRPYYAMRFIRGNSLKQAIERFHGEPGCASDGSVATTRSGTTQSANTSSLAFRQLLRRFLDVCNAIDYAHSRGVLHRDIKPANIILGKHGETLVVDWGLAKATGKGERAAEEQTLLPSSASGSAETLPGSVLGTPAYMSPEQARGDIESLGPASDIYSLGATLYCLLTGRAPFEGAGVGVVLDRVRRGDFPKPRSVRPEIPEPLEAICKKAMALEPADRYRTPKALAEDVERWMAEEPVAAWREPLRIRAGRWMRRHKTLVATTAVSAPLLLAGTVVSGALALRAIVAEGAARLDRDRALAAETKAKAEISKTEAALARATKEEEKAKKSAAESRESRGFSGITYWPQPVPGARWADWTKTLPYDRPLTRPSRRSPERSKTSRPLRRTSETRSERPTITSVTLRRLSPNSSAHWHYAKQHSGPTTPRR